MLRGTFYFVPHKENLNFSEEKARTRDTYVRIASENQGRVQTECSYLDTELNVLSWVSYPGLPLT